MVQWSIERYRIEEALVCQRRYPCPRTDLVRKSTQLKTSIRNHQHYSVVSLGRSKHQIRGVPNGDLSSLLAAVGFRLLKEGAPLLGYKRSTFRVSIEAVLERSSCASDILDAACLGSPIARIL